MPFGKHRGCPIGTIPHDYLCWVLDNCDNLKPTLRRVIETELGIASEPTAETTAVSQDVVGPWFRTLSKEFHPDKRGGSHEAMKAINRAKEVLVELMELV